MYKLSPARLRMTCNNKRTAVTDRAEEGVEDVLQKVTSACDAATPRRGNGNPHKPVYRWSDRIAQLRAKYHKARRLSERARGKPTFHELEEKFKLAWSKLTKAIKHSKRQSWTELLGVVDEDPWGRPYKIVIARPISFERIKKNVLKKKFYQICYFFLNKTFKLSIQLQNLISSKLSHT